MKVYIKSVSDIYASSMSRIIQHTKDSNVATITAFITSDSDDRPTKKRMQSHNQNKVINSQLSRDLQKLGYGFSKVTGYWDETKSGDPNNAVREETFYVICPKVTPYDAFEKSIIALAKKYEQQAVVVWSYEKQEAKLLGTDDYQTYSVWDTFSNFNVDVALSEAWTQFKNHNFVFSSDVLDFVVDSATELTNCANGPTAFIAAKHFRELLLKEYA